MLMRFRPKPKNCEKEEPPQEGEPFDYDAEPNRFYFDVETVGGLKPDEIIHEGIKVIRTKLAELIHNLLKSDENGDGRDDGFGQGPRSPNMDVDAPAAWQDNGSYTPYGNGGGGGGGQSAWGGQATTPYTQTPYGQSGQSGWN